MADGPGRALLAGLAARHLPVIAGCRWLIQPGDYGSVDAIAILVIVSFIIGISRAWEPDRRPSTGSGTRSAALVHAISPAGGRAASAASAGG